eukprot:CAMPEP_0169481788 /NCGR_PEP_ID=MMETSP1042-20121227/30316_1 /TAXON_ID=464988 /ORGANISM="Hemiselmis andersenii, Strain CCMP1180" /LENGTH=43 /DNA_ID= /DNA_START= /DNA_END= /DNA_ORIENTATION=
MMRAASATPPSAPRAPASCPGIWSPGGEEAAQAAQDATRKRVR